MSDTTSASYEALIEFLYRTPIGLVQTTSSGEITMINPMAAQLLMPLAPDGSLLNLFDVLAAVAPQLRELAGVNPAPGAVLCEALRLPLPAGRSTPAVAPTLAISLLRLDAATLMCSVSDVTLQVQQEQQRLASRLREATRTDSLTSLPNRTVVIERIDAALRRARAEPDYKFAVIFINADRFDRINVTHGQSAGDELLRLMAARLNATVRARDAVGRALETQPTAACLGGDEFVVVLEGLRAAEDAGSVSQRLVAALGRPYAIDDRPVHITVSMGVITHELAAGHAESLLQDASLAMRQAKREGGARYCQFEPRIKENAWKRGHLENDLRRALIDGELFVVYQPIVDLATTATVGFEALVRWRHPLRGSVPPLEFIGIAEETGLIGPLGEFVLNEACRQLVAWGQALGHHSPPLISVNLSRAQLLEPGIVATVQAALRASGLRTEQLQLEVTESLAAQEQVIQDRLHELKRLGLKLALDDFGTGYSSLACLHQLPIDVVKIDRSFVSLLESSPHHRVLVEATVQVARSLDLDTVAEGIETEGQAAVLTALRCGRGQGYLYGRPMPGKEATDWLTARADCHRQPPGSRPQKRHSSVGLSKAARIGES